MMIIIKEKIRRLGYGCLLLLSVALAPNSVGRMQPTSDHHVIQVGDTVRSIARLYNTTATKLRKINGLTSSRLLVGGWLKVRDENDFNRGFAYTVHRVRRRDTLSRISQQYGVSINSIKSINGLSHDVIYVGQRLRLFKLGNGKRPKFDREFAIRLAENAKAYARRRPSHGYCLRGVRRALTKTLIEKKQSIAPRGFLNMGPHAAFFLREAERNPLKLCRKMGLANASYLPTSTTSGNEQRSKGLIYLYTPGRCGFHSMYGHVEVVVDTNKTKACSDHCRALGPYCSPDLVLAPVKSCEWLW